MLSRFHGGFLINSQNKFISLHVFNWNAEKNNEIFIRGQKDKKKIFLKPFLNIKILTPKGKEPI